MVSGRARGSDFKQASAMSERCDQCRESPAVTSAPHWYAVLAIVLLGSIASSGRYCKDCAGGRTFLALLFGACTIVVAFVVVVALW